MVLNKWTSGDTITEREANNHGVRKGTETEIGCIASADREVGDLFFNSTSGFAQVQTGGGACDERGNLTSAPMGADANEVTVTGTTPTQRKSFSFIKNSVGYNGNQITVLAEVKTSNAGTTANFRIRKNGACTDDLILTTTCVAFEIKTGTIDITCLADGRHTLEFFMDDGCGDTITNRELEIVGI